MSQYTSLYSAYFLKSYCSYGLFYCIFHFIPTMFLVPFIFLQLLSIFVFFMFFLVSLNCLSVLTCSSLRFLITVFLNYLLGRLQISKSLGLITGRLCNPLVVLGYFDLEKKCSWRFVLLSSLLKYQPPTPVFANCLQEKNTFCWPSRLRVSEAFSDLL